MITTHQYLDKYLIAAESEKLIVGTIHPHQHQSFSIPFFYGNVSSLWILLSNAFPNELKKPITLEGVLNFLHNKKIAVSDTIRKCSRKNLTAFDSDLIPIELNTKMIADIRKSAIKEILFTSGFGKNSAFKLFYTDILGLKITQEIKENREIIMGESIFGRPIKLKVLYSPSGSSNVGIAQSKLYKMNQAKYKNSKRPVHDFKLDYYKNIFS
ncbi:MAG: hypothetical protein R2798_04550 [Chitinophagales bacterium]|nr:hypothetical protein [Bacteroidota bacterium]MCB9044321.1 hypothetical protein [Chitinophagales bacterium]